VAGDAYDSGTGYGHDSGGYEGDVGGHGYGVENYEGEGYGGYPDGDYPGSGYDDGGFGGDGSEQSTGDPNYKARRHRPSANDTNVGTLADFAAYGGYDRSSSGYDRGGDERYVQGYDPNGYGRW
jgi:hypothetical protein